MTTNQTTIKATYHFGLNTMGDGALGVHADAFAAELTKAAAEKGIELTVTWDSQTDAIKSTIDTTDAADWNDAGFELQAIAEKVWEAGAFWSEPANA